MATKKLNVVPLLVPEAGYVLDEQVGFLMRVAMQRHTSIFSSRMIEGLTQTQFAALAKLYEVAARVAESSWPADLSRRRDDQGRGRPAQRARLRHRAERPEATAGAAPWR